MLLLMLLEDAIEDTIGDAIRDDVGDAVADAIGDAIALCTRCSSMLSACMLFAATGPPSSLALSSLAKRVSTMEARHNAMAAAVVIVFACLLDTVLDSGFLACNDSYEHLPEYVCP